MQLDAYLTQFWKQKRFQSSLQSWENGGLSQIK